ncbi:GtrA family protein [Candidatus Kaiserbacteria bacterium]|nr:GtrA family protein [Candidatus Kaiserbacteria bacterium]
MRLGVHYIIARNMGLGLILEFPCYTSRVRLLSMAHLLPSIQAAYARANTNYPFLARLVRFVISGGTATAVNLGILFLLTHIFGLWYLTSSIIAFMVAFFVSFTLQKFWTFEDASRSRLRSQAIIYFLIILFDLGVNTALMYFFVEHLHLHYLIAQLISGVMIAVMNYFSYKHLVFRGTDAQKNLLA